jgi:Na+/citrate or Na+/malate symporter
MQANVAGSVPVAGVPSEAPDTLPAEAHFDQGKSFWPEGWWRLMDLRIGIIPVPVYAVLVVLVAGLIATDGVKSDAPTMIAVLVLGGFTCAEIGKRLPVLRSVGAGWGRRRR